MYVDIYFTKNMNVSSVFKWRTYIPDKMENVKKFSER